MLNGNMEGAYTPGAMLPQSQQAPPAPRQSSRPADYDALKAEFDRLAGEVGAGPEPAPNEPATPALGGAMGPVVPSEGTPESSNNKKSAALQGALKGAARAATDEEAIAMLQAILTR